MTDPDEGLTASVRDRPGGYFGLFHSDLPIFGPVPGGGYPLLVSRAHWPTNARFPKPGFEKGTSRVTHPLSLEVEHGRCMGKGFMGHDTAIL